MLHLYSMEAAKEILFKVIDFIIIDSVPIIVVIGIVAAIAALSLDAFDKIKERRKKRQEYYNKHKEEIESRKLKRKTAIKDALLTILAIIIGLIMLGIFFGHRTERNRYYDDWPEYYLDRPDKL